MSLDYIFLDWDGCLAKTLDLWLQAYKDICEERGIDISKMSDTEIVEKSFGKWALGLKNLGIKDYDLAYKEAVDKIMQVYANVVLYPGAEELLIRLKEKGKKIALISSSYRSWLERPLKHQRLEKYFDFVVARDDVRHGKPDPEQIYLAAKNLSANLSKAVIVGDSDGDIKAGKAAKISTVCFYPEANEKFYKKDFLTSLEPDHVIRKLLELLNIVD